MFYLKLLYLGEIKPKSTVVVSVPSGFDLRQKKKIGDRNSHWNVPLMGVTDSKIRGGGSYHRVSKHASPVLQQGEAAAISGSCYIIKDTVTHFPALRMGTHHSVHLL